MKVISIINNSENYRVPCFLSFFIILFNEVNKPPNGREIRTEVYRKCLKKLISLINQHASSSPVTRQVLLV